MKSGIGYILILVGLGLAGSGTVALWQILFTTEGALASGLVGKSELVTFYSIWLAVGIGILFGGVKLVKSAKKVNETKQIS